MGSEMCIRDSWILTENPVNNIATVIIEGRVLRRKSVKVIEAERKSFSDSYRLRKLEAYVSDGEALKERAANLPKPLAERMERFAQESGVEFWIDSAPYEMFALEGAAALLKKAADEVGLAYNGFDFASTSNGKEQEAIQWIEDWWALNTKEHDYNYKKQMELVPDFGDGHSGNTAGAACALALAVLRGEEV